MHISERNMRAQTAGPSINRTQRQAFLSQAKIVGPQTTGLRARTDALQAVAALGYGDVEASPDDCSEVQHKETSEDMALHHQMPFRETESRRKDPKRSFESYQLQDSRDLFVGVDGGYYRDSGMDMYKRGDRQDKIRESHRKDIRGVEGVHFQSETIAGLEQHSQGDSSGEEQEAENLKKEFRRVMQRMHRNSGRRNPPAATSDCLQDTSAEFPSRFGASVSSSGSTGAARRTSLTERTHTIHSQHLHSPVTLRPSSASPATHRAHIDSHFTQVSKDGVFLHNESLQGSAERVEEGQGRLFGQMLHLVEEGSSNWQNELRHLVGNAAEQSREASASSQSLLARYKEDIESLRAELSVMTNRNASLLNSITPQVVLLLLSSAQCIFLVTRHLSLFVVRC